MAVAQVNFFFLDRDPQACARAHGDKHLVKMVLEAAQLCSTVWHNKADADPTFAQRVAPTIYRATHRKNPITLWAGKSRANYLALARYGLELVAEKRRRMVHMATLEKGLQRTWSTQHKSEPVLEFLRDNPPPLAAFPEGDTWSDPPLCMPEWYRTDAATGQTRDAVAAYRLYYAGSKVRVTGLKWLPYVEVSARACIAVVIVRLRDLTACHRRRNRSRRGWTRARRRSTAIPSCRRVWLRSWLST